MERLPYLLMAAVWWLLGAFVVRWPQTLSGYNTMPPERREAVDIRGAGRFLERLCRLSALLTLAGLPLAGTAAGRWLLVLPVGLLLAGAVAARRYDMCAAARRVRRGKERFLPLLLEGEGSAVCAVTDEGDGRFEVKNLAVAAPFRRQGYGRRMLACVTWRYRRRGAWLTLGTGETPSPFASYRPVPPVRPPGAVLHRQLRPSDRRGGGRTERYDSAAQTAAAAERCGGTLVKKREQ